MSKPKAVLISDIHYSLNTLQLADAAMRQAISTANRLKVPLIVAGDLHDTKANLRGECVETMLDTFALATTPVYVLAGNHDLINEKSDKNALEFLRNAVSLVKHPCNVGHFHFLPYFSNSDLLIERLKQIPKGSTIIMHQGVHDADSGEYVHDKSALDSKVFDGYRVISGHYHARQTIKCGDTGVLDYIGNPYTLTFGESKDPEKGFQVLNDDGSLTFTPTNLRKHIVFDMFFDSLYKLNVNPDDLVKVKLTGTKEQLASLSRKALDSILGTTKYKLDLFPLDTSTAVSTITSVSAPSLLDETIEQTSNISKEQKERLKLLWRRLNEKT